MDIMNFPQTVDEFMEQYKIVDREEVYTNGAEMIPIFRMKQWFEHEALDKDIDVPSKSALDHIHNVVRDDAYRRGYEQGKADAMKFIPASESQKEDGVYLVYAPEYRGGSSSGKENYGGVMFCKWKNGKWTIEHGYYNRPGCVKGWMPIPKGE